MRAGWRRAAHVSSRSATGLAVTGGRQHTCTSCGETAQLRGSPVRQYMRLSALRVQPGRLTCLHRVAIRTLCSGGEPRAGVQAAAAAAGSGSGGGGGSGGPSTFAPPSTSISAAAASAATSGGNGASAVSASAGPPVPSTSSGGAEEPPHVYRKGARAVFEMPSIKDSIELTEEEAQLFKELLEASKAVSGAAGHCRAFVGAGCAASAGLGVPGAAASPVCRALAEPAALHSRPPAPAPTRCPPAAGGPGHHAALRGRVGARQADGAHQPGH